LTKEALHLIHDGLCRRLQAEGVMVDAIYYCPHHPDDGCMCRKPQIGMIDRAVADLGIDLSRAYLVGDKAHDVELARRAGTRSILVTTGPNSREALALLQTSGTPPDYVASALDEAADWILRDVKVCRSPTGAPSRVG
jgi:heptosyltransferase-2